MWLVREIERNTHILANFRPWKENDGKEYEPAIIKLVW
jgi:hypothetical protein